MLLTRESLFQISLCGTTEIFVEDTLNNTLYDQASFSLPVHHDHSLIRYRCPRINRINRISPPPSRIGTHHHNHKNGRGTFRPPHRLPISIESRRT
mmetsp:Transcript_26588/g.48172  ORF Transcript_26588/g.48172 Transcript_26588/m.48172 type:complete len:96 (+) Transcript_26588:98-385(+)